MAVDWGFLQGIRANDNWQAIRQEEGAQLQRVAMQNALLEQRNAKQQEAQQELQKYMSVVQDIHVLDPDAKKIDEYNQKLKEPIREGLLRYKGDAMKWLDSGGRVELQKYINGLKEGAPVKLGLMNALNHNKSIADEEAGLTHRPTAWDSNGQVQSGDYEQNYQDYISGKTDRLNYRGGYKAPAGDPMKEFSQTYGKDRYTAEAVDPEAVYQFWLDKGATLKPADAQHNALVKTRQYMEHLQQGKEPYRRKADNPIDMQLKLANFELAQKRLELYANKVNGSLKKAADPYGMVFGGTVGVPQDMNVNANAFSQAWGQQSNGDPQASVNVPTMFTPFTDEKVKEVTAKALFGLKYDKKEGGYIGKITNGDHIRSYGNFTPALADLNDVPFVVKNIVGNVHIPNPQNPKEAQNFVVMDVNAKKGDLDLLGANNHHWFIPDSETAFSQGQIKYGEGKGATVRILVPVPTDDISATRYSYDLKELNPKYESQYAGQQDIQLSPEIDKYLDEPVNTDAQ